MKAECTHTDTDRHSTKNRDLIDFWKLANYCVTMKEIELALLCLNVIITDTMTNSEAIHYFLANIKRNTQKAFTKLIVRFILSEFLRHFGRSLQVSLSRLSFVHLGLLPWGDFVLVLKAFDPQVEEHADHSVHSDVRHRRRPWRRRLSSSPPPVISPDDGDRPTADESEDSRGRETVVVVVVGDESQKTDARDDRLGNAGTEISDLNERRSTGRGRTLIHLKQKPTLTRIRSLTLSDIIWPSFHIKMNKYIY